ncbi:hypothetical protein VOLCADRAFT_107490 [Volvox carteri f. nagariensis]|uniref:Bifunctional lysine-specific demethylase and histidyl-hydroxylase n=1 Tax=Volvox carteri f. nagariensis TaxID=3068 RepID=D8UEA8_VOLCA|nr:uncharacterized protein VOLCADRAFT_107490 [Volvox carteri f. nagariensis]EFJ41937.1 hypothetical protein VOLCADRAFT_107490 [Volvox carteri f. nagariensis]|eukprot:XP_002956974.1 hypothetical protein VOLCADRAFT_107490 [Volvox carteri f. nagariensis]
MTKRKLSGGEAAPAEEPEAADVQEEEEEPAMYAPGPVDMNPLQFLIAPTELSTFSSEYWEKKPLHIPADEERKNFFDGLFDFDELCKVSDALEAGVMLLMDQDPGPKGDALSFEDDVDDQMVRAIGPLVFGRDVVAVRYVDGERETLAGEFADSDTLRTLHETEGATLQLHQPQRFVNALWRLVAALEAQSGCLVGCNAYVTPGGGQGLAPHHDDVELFVCQTKGSKKWRLYKPVNDFELPSKVSGDLPQDELGEPILEVTMNPGDVLYVPRGIPHQAVAQEEGSCHLTISTYQRWTWGDLAVKLLETARDAQGSSPASALPLELRKGLPLGLIFKHGIQAEMMAADSAAAAAAAHGDAAALAAGLRALAAQLEKGPTELLAPAVDELSLDFLVHRMPPHPCQLPDPGEEPGLEDSLVCRGKNLFRIVPYEDEDEEENDSDEEEDEDEDDEDEEGAGGKKEPLVKLVTCLGNSRFTHMISSRSEDEEESDDEGHHEHGPGLCGPLCGASESDDEEMGEGEEEEKEEEGKAGKGKKSAKKSGKEEGEKEEKVAKDKEETKGEKEKQEEKEEEGDEEPEIMDVDEDEDDDEGEDGSGGEDESDDDEEEEEQLQGPIFPAVYAAALAEVLSATADKPLPVKKLQVPGKDSDEQLQLARLLYHGGFVITVPGAKQTEEEGKKASKEKKAATEKKAGGKKAAAADKETKEEEGAKPSEDKKDELPKKAGGKKAAAAAGNEEGEAKEKKGPTPPAKKAKKAK